MAHETFRGEWYIPSRPEIRLKGVLAVSKSKKKYRLKLYANMSLHGQEFLANHSFLDDVTGYSIILGVCFPEEKITLRDAEIRSVGPIANDMVIIVIEPVTIYVGYHFNSEGDIKMKSLACSFSYLASWVDKMERYFDNLGQKTFKDLYLLQYEFSIPLPEDITINFHRGIHKDEFSRNKKLSFEIFHTVIFTARENIRFDLLNEKADHLRRLIEVAAGKKVHILYRWGSVDLVENSPPPKNRAFPDESKVDLRVIMGFTGDNKDDEVSMPLNNMLFNTHRLGREGLIEVIRKWYETIGGYEQVYNIYLDTNKWFQKTGVYLTEVMYFNRLLNHVQALESFQTMEDPEVPESKSDFVERLNSILSKIDSEDDRLWLADHANMKHKHLSQRLRQLLKDHDIVVSEMFGNSDAKKSFIYKLGAVRNQLSHGRKGSTQVEDTRELYFKSKVLLVSCILHKLGMSKEQIKSALTQSTQFSSEYGYYVSLKSQQ